MNQSIILIYSIWFYRHAQIQINFYRFNITNNMEIGRE